MSLALVHSRALLGLRAPSVTVEVHLANGLPSFTLVGLADTEVKEARERVRCAIQNSGFDFHSNKRITVNLAPAVARGLHFQHMETPDEKTSDLDKSGACADPLSCSESRPCQRRQIGQAQQNGHVKQRGRGQERG